MGVQLRCFGAVMRGMRAMARSAMGMVGGGFGLVFFIVFGGHAVMMCRFFMMVRSRMMMRAGGMLVRHEEALFVLDRSQHSAIPRNKHVSALYFSRISRVQQSMKWWSSNCRTAPL
jgi:hypothetical protein